MLTYAYVWVMEVFTCAKYYEIYVGITSESGQSIKAVNLIKCSSYEALIFLVFSLAKLTSMYMVNMARRF